MKATASVNDIRKEIMDSGKRLQSKRKVEFQKTFNRLAVATSLQVST